MSQENRGQKTEDRKKFSHGVVAMKTRIVRIGNSQGVRIPKFLLDQAGLQGEVDIKVKDDTLVIKPARPPRAGWAAAFQEMAKGGDDSLLEETTPTHWDGDEWQW